MCRLHGLDCRELELVGQVHALLLQLAAGFADALRDLSCQPSTVQLHGVTLDAIPPRGTFIRL